MGDSFKVRVKNILLYFGSFVILLSLWLPWLRSGSNTKNSFSVFRIANLFLDENFWFQVLRGTWLMIPPLILSGLLIKESGRKRLGYFIVQLSSLLVLIVAVGFGMRFSFQLGEVVACVGFTIVTSAFIAYISL